MARGNLNLTKTAFNMLLAKIKLDFRRFKDLNFQAIRGNNRFVHTNDLDRLDICIQQLMFSLVSPRILYNQLVGHHFL